MIRRGDRGKEQFWSKPLNLRDLKNRLTTYQPVGMKAA
jgi:hypothetical protein